MPLAISAVVPRGSNVVFRSLSGDRVRANSLDEIMAEEFGGEGNHHI